MGSGQSSPRNSATQIQVQNADYTPTEQFVDKGKPLFKKSKQNLPSEDPLENIQDQNGKDFKCKVEKDLEQVSISENEIHGLWHRNESELTGNHLYDFISRILIERTFCATVILYQKNFIDQHPLRTQWSLADKKILWITSAIRVSAPHIKVKCTTHNP